MFPIIFLSLLLSSGVVECGRRPIDPNTLAALAAAEQRRQQLHSTREDRRAKAYGAQAFRGAVQMDCSPPELLAHP